MLPASLEHGSNIEILDPLVLQRFVPSYGGGEPVGTSHVAFLVEAEVEIIILLPPAKVEVREAVDLLVMAILHDDGPADHLSIRRPIFPLGGRRAQMRGPLWKGVGVLGIFWHLVDVVEYYIVHSVLHQHVAGVEHRTLVEDMALCLLRHHDLELHAGFRQKRGDKRNELVQVRTPVYPLRRRIFRVPEGHNHPQPMPGPPISASCYELGYRPRNAGPYCGRCCRREFGGWE
mmetsp:Transcript_2192/g.4010  ORF Transcript_2192/g.4010 Transcript_2192/m.4010 type:complete len:232 (-) Transcript_2192:1367-2062(-)